MLSFKRFLYIILLVAILSGIFLVYNINEGQFRYISLENRIAPAQEFVDALKTDAGENTTVLILGDAADEGYGGIYRNVRQLCGDLHITAVEETYLDVDRAAEADVVIFCHADVGRYADLTELGSFIAGGGRVILAAGLAEGEADSSLWQALGIRGKSAGGNYHDLVFEEPLLPVQPEQAVYGGDSASVQLDVEEDAVVYLRDEKTEVPILYTYAYEKGEICLVNGCFLLDIRCAGLLTGAIGAVLPDFLYPVLGVKTVFLDNFPMTTATTDEICMQMYGSSTTGFVRDVVWPAFQGISLRTDTPYSSSVLAVAPSEDYFPTIHDAIFTTIGKSALQVGGELVYGANCPENGDIVFNQNFIDRFSAIFKNYTIQGLTLESDNFSPGMLRVPGADIRFVRGMLDSSDMRLSWEEDLTVFPGATAGNSMEDGNLFSACSVIGAYGLVSHVFDVNALFVMDGEVTAWDLGKKQIGLFESEILSRVPWLVGRTLSQTESDVKSYLSLDYGWRRNGSRLEMDCGGAVKGQAFFYHTDSRIVGADGLTYQDVGNGYYLLRIQENHGSIELDGGK